MSTLKPLTIDIVSDVVCPWCYIGKHRIEEALKQVTDVPVEVHWRPFFLNPWVPREGISREDYLTTKFGSVEAYKGIAGRVVAAASEQCEATADPELIKLYSDLKAFPIPARSGPLPPDNVAIPFKLRHDGEVLSFFSTTMVFGTPVDITLSELALETFFPADDLTADRMRSIAAGLK